MDLTIPTLALAMMLAAVTTPVMIVLARRTGIVDVPGPLKPHARPTPYLGGVAVALGGAAASAWTIGASWALVPLLLAMTVGLVDDVRGLPARVRIVVQGVVGMMIAWTVGADTLLAVAAVILLTLLLVNAVNFVDGVDGLAAGTCCVCAISLALVLPGTWAASAAAWAGAAAGFLVFNKPPARIFLGDAGSYALGAVLALHAAAALNGSGPDWPAPVRAGVIAALVGYPVIELLSTIGRRLLRRRPLLRGDREHLYDRFIDRGHSASTVTLALIAAQVLLSVSAVVAWTTGSQWMAGVASLATLLAVTACATHPRSAAEVPS